MSLDWSFKKWLEINWNRAFSILSKKVYNDKRSLQLKFWERKSESCLGLVILWIEFKLTNIIELKNG
jgi:hypothetical protein